MYWPGVAELKAFYTTQKGKLVQAFIAKQIKAVCTNIKDSQVVGLGFALPYLGSFLAKDKKNYVAAAMPYSSGVIHWPPERRNRTLISDESELPFPDESVDLMVVVHVLEYSSEVREMMREIWRVLHPGGKLIVIVPNRQGIWAHIEGSPFSHGQPYSCIQLSNLLKDSMFVPLSWRTILFAWPSNWHLVLRLTSLFEWMGRLLFPMLGGIVMIEAEKQIYSMSDKTRMRKKLRSVIPARTSSGFGRNRL